MTLRILLLTRSSLLLGYLFIISICTHRVLFLGFIIHYLIILALKLSQIWPQGAPSHRGPRPGDTVNVFSDRFLIASIIRGAGLPCTYSASSSDGVSLGAGITDRDLSATRTFSAGRTRKQMNKCDSVCVYKYVCMYTHTLTVKIYIHRGHTDIPIRLSGVRSWHVCL